MTFPPFFPTFAQWEKGGIFRSKEKVGGGRAINGSWGKEAALSFSPQDTADSGCLLLSTPASTKCKPAQMWSTNKEANTTRVSVCWAAAMLPPAVSPLHSNKSLLMEDLELLNSWVRHYKGPGPPHQWCKTQEQRQANPLSCCASCVKGSGRGQTEAGRETGLGYRQLLRVCTVCVEPWEASRIPPHHFHFITPEADIHYSALQASVHRDR